MKIVPASIHSSALGVVSVVLLACALFACTALYLQPKGRVSCADFGSYIDIPSDWKATTPWLDRAYHSKSDGIPCNSLYKRWVKYHK